MVEVRRNDTFRTQVSSDNELNQLCELCASSSLRYQCITPFTLGPYRPAPQRESTGQLLLKVPREDAGTNTASHVVVCV